MNEKRRLPRKRPEVTLQVTDAMSGDIAGRLGNLSREGMLLIARVPIVENGLYQFTFHLPDASGRLQPIEVGVNETWSEASSVRGQAWAGFRFIDMSAEDERVLCDWLMNAADRNM